MTISEETQKTIAEDIEREVKFIVGRKVITLPEGAISTIMAIVRVRLEQED